MRKFLVPAAIAVFSLTGNLAAAAPAAVTKPRAVPYEDVPTDVWGLCKTLKNDPSKKKTDCISFYNSCCPTPEVLERVQNGSKVANGVNGAGGLIEIISKGTVIEKDAKMSGLDKAACVAGIVGSAAGAKKAIDDFNACETNPADCPTNPYNAISAGTKQLCSYLACARAVPALAPYIAGLQAACTLGELGATLILCNNSSFSMTRACSQQIVNAQPVQVTIGTGDTATSQVQCCDGCRQEFRYDGQFSGYKACGSQVCGKFVSTKQLCNNHDGPYVPVASPSCGKNGGSFYRYTSSKFLGMQDSGTCNTFDFSKQ